MADLVKTEIAARPAAASVLSSPRSAVPSASDPWRSWTGSASASAGFHSFPPVPLRAGDSSLPADPWAPRPTVSRFIPDKLWIRGWIRYVRGVPDFAGISEPVAQDIIKIIESRLPRELLAKLQSLPHKFGFRVKSIVLNAKPGTTKDEIWQVRNGISAIFDAVPLSISVLGENRLVRCAVDKPPWMRERDSALGTAGDVWEKLMAPGTVLTRDFLQGQLWITSPSEVHLGSFVKGRWVWSASALALIPRDRLDSAWAEFG